MKVRKEVRTNHQRVLDEDLSKAIDEAMRKMIMLENQIPKFVITREMIYDNQF